jgi:hypothetical protein
MADDISTRLEVAREKSAKDRDARAKEVAQVRAENELALHETIAPEHGVIGSDIDAVFSKHTGDMVVVKRPTLAAFRMFQRDLNAGKMDPNEVALRFVKSCLVYPAIEVFSEIQTRAPAMLVTCADAAAALAGTGSETLEGK